MVELNREDRLEKRLGPGCHINTTTGCRKLEKYKKNISQLDEELFELALDLLLHQVYNDGISAHNISCILQWYVEIYEKEEHNRIKE